jgi:hypothetical protein
MSPLYAGRVADALKGRGDEFSAAQREMQSDMKRMRDALERFKKMRLADIDARLAQWTAETGHEHVGARPTSEQESGPFVVKFDSSWLHHRDARDWAADTLAGVTTFAADGSQIFPSGDMSIPVGLIQVGWFENPHDQHGSYTKDVQVDVLTPAELTREYEPGYAEREIEWRRFRNEMLQTMMFLKRMAGKRALAFVDGSLILSFVHTMREPRQREYIRLVQDLLDLSESTGVPVVGYVDSSQAADLSGLVQAAAGYNGQRMGDAVLVQRDLAWGDRCRMFVCDRDDEVIDSSYYPRVCFTYLRTTRDHPPARVEMPGWVFEAGLHEQILDVVRAECVVGVGYPYPLETADAVAVLSMQDRERFYRLFQEFARERDIPVHFSRKSISKRGRRL